MKCKTLINTVAGLLALINIVVCALRSVVNETFSCLVALVGPLNVTICTAMSKLCTEAGEGGLE
jgi:hypothetical protein